MKNKHSRLKLVSVRLLLFLETFLVTTYVSCLITSYLLSHCRDCRGSSNLCLAFTVPVKGFWLTVVETQTFPWPGLHACDCWAGQTFRSGVVPLPRNKPLTADCRSWGHPMAVTFPGAAGEVFAAPGRVANAGDQRLPAWCSKLCWIGKVTQKQTFCVNC